MIKLPDFRDFEALNRLKRAMGIARDVLGEVSPTKLSKRERRQLATSGIETTIDQVGVLADGTLVYKDQRIILYIRDVNETARYDDPKFHISNCDTVRLMRENKRLERFVVADRSDGEFELRYVGSGRVRKVEKRLAVCKYCLNILRYNGYASTMPRAAKDHAVSSFSVDEFFVKYPKSFHADVPKQTSSTAPTNDYAGDWEIIARQFKEHAGWRCQKCQVNLSRQDLRKYLHVHHENGQKHDNTPENLKALCIRCHAEQFQHGHLKATGDYEAFSRIRRQRGVSPEGESRPHR